MYSLREPFGEMVNFRSLAPAWERLRSAGEQRSTEQRHSGPVLDLLKTFVGMAGC